MQRLTNEEGMQLQNETAASTEGPIGWRLDKAASAYVDILPGTGKQTSSIPDTGNIAEIIQYAMFGNASHT